MHQAHRHALPACLLVALTALAGCGGGSPARPPGERTVKGVPVTASLTAEQQAEVERLTALQAMNAKLTPDELLRKRAIPFQASLGYDPRAAKNLDLIQASSLKLLDHELALLAKNGFVISDRVRYPHFGYGYKAIYSQDLPLFVSADSILQGVHQSYDDILKALEHEALIPELEKLLGGMRTALAARRDLDAVTRADVDLFLTVAVSLLSGNSADPVAGGDRNLIATLIRGANSAGGTAEIPLFGVADRIIDFSQFTPRGHYLGDAKLERYFRAMMWLGRIDFPFIHTDMKTGKQLLVRPAIAAAFTLRALLDDGALARWQRLDDTIRAFVGEPDSMAPPAIDRLKADLGLPGYDVGAVDDEALTAAIVKGAYGRQKILSQVVIQPPHAGAWPLDAVFLFFGQRYTFDSHVLSNVVYDRIPQRMMPNPLDVAYAALGNDHAAKLLEPQLRKYSAHSGALESMRQLGDEHGSAFWDANLYNLWSGALRALAPGPEIGQGGGLPAVARTEPWARRVLSTQLASWAQLRRDTILYVKQSYTSGAACEFPDAYVDPYPAFFAKLNAFALAGERLASQLPLPADGYLSGRVRTYFANLARVTGTLREMAELQRAGMPHKPEHLAFVNQAVDTKVIGCGGPPALTGWYADLFFDANDALDFDPTIADVHTVPTGEQPGDPDGQVLHVGTGWVRQMVTTIDTCMGPRAYVGLAYSYHEHITRDYQRLDDKAWATHFENNKVPADVPWMTDLIAK